MNTKYIYSVQNSGVNFPGDIANVAPQPKELEPVPVALHHGLDEFQSAISGMDVPRVQPGPQTVTLAAEAKKRMETILGKMAIVSDSLLLAVGWVLGGIQINDEPFFQRLQAP